MNTPPTPQLPGDGGDSLVSFLSVAMPLVVLVGMAFWVWPHVARAIASAATNRTTRTGPEPDDVPDTDEENPVVVEHRSAELPTGLDLSIYSDRTRGG